MTISWLTTGTNSTSGSLGTREPKTTRKKNEDGSEMVITKFDLAVNRRNKHEGNADADFFHCTSFGRQAEFVEKYFHSGSRVLVVGRVQNNNYTTKEGNKVYGFSIITEEVEFAQKKSAGKAAADADDFSYAADEQVPFESRSVITWQKVSSEAKKDLQSFKMR